MWCKHWMVCEGQIKRRDATRILHDTGKKLTVSKMCILLEIILGDGCSFILNFYQ